MNPYAEYLLAALSVAGCVWLAAFVRRVEAEVPENKALAFVWGLDELEMGRKPTDKERKGNWSRGVSETWS